MSQSMIFNEKLIYHKIFLHIFLHCCAQYSLELNKQRVLHSRVLNHKVLHSIVLPYRVVYGKVFCTVQFCTVMFCTTEFCTVQFAHRVVHQSCTEGKVNFGRPPLHHSALQLHNHDCHFNNYQPAFAQCSSHALFLVWPSS